MLCQYLGKDTGNETETDLCCGQGTQAVYTCERKSLTVLTGRPYAPGISTCAACDVRQQPATFPAVAPVAYQDIKLPSKAMKEGAFNCSLHAHDGPGFLFAYRSKWTQSDVRIGKLTDSYQAMGQLMPTMILHEKSSRGREDPRLFRFRGEWHFSFTGYESREHFSSVLYAKIGTWPFVSKVYYPRYGRRNHAEKNWVFFDHDGELHAVYSIGPGEHRVLKIDGERVVGEYSTDWKPSWAWGVMRGGASPQRVGDEYYSWFHGVANRDGCRIYTVGLYTFEAKPPFRPLRLVEDPMAVAGYSMWCNGLKAAKYIIFPCGAALKKGRWHVSAGEHDSKCSAISFDADAIERALKPVRLKHFRVGEIPAILSLNGWCTEDKAERLSELVAGIPERVNGVEIGVFAGRSLFAAAAGVRANPHGGKILGIDSYDAEENLKGIDTPEHRSHWRQSLVDDAKASMLATREKLGLEAFCDVLVSTSADAIVGIPHTLNYLHIDGNHSKAGAVSDAELYLPCVKVGGLVVVDDTHADGKVEFLDGVQDCVRVVEQSCDLVEDHGTWRVYRKVL